MTLAVEAVRLMYDASKKKSKVYWARLEAEFWFVKEMRILRSDVKVGV